MVQIKKIISGGQTGADQGALDAAIKLGVPHGGWIPKGRLTENGVLPDKYELKELPTQSYTKRTEKNILDSRGTVIISHGKLTGGSALTEKLATIHKRPCLHINLNTMPMTEAALNIHSWIDKHGIEILNVAGPRSSEDSKIYRKVKDIIETVIRLSLTNAKSHR